MRGAGFHCLISCGPIGTDGKGGHCHNDKLSLTLCVDGKEILIDPGIYVYTASKEYRDLYRSVCSHNTVALADKEQNRFLDGSPWWGCHEDTRCKCIKWENSLEQAVFIGQHEGYLRLDTPVLHRRQILWLKRNRKVVITDAMIKQDSAKLAPPMQWTFMLHPECQIMSVEEQLATVERGGMQLDFLTSSGRWQTSTGFYSPSYGIKRGCPRLTIDFPIGVAENTVTISWK